MYLLLIFIAIPIIEISIFIKFGGILGTVNTILLIFLTAVIGIYFVKLQGFGALQKIKDDLSNHIAPVTGLFDGLVILISGLLLLIPGFFTDFIGFCGLIPITRYFFARFLITKFFINNSNFANQHGKDINEPIEAEFSEIKEDDKD